MKQVKVPIKGQFENYANPRAHNELKQWAWKMESLDALAFIVSPIKTGLSKGHPRMTFCFQNYCEKKMF